MAYDIFISYRREGGSDVARQIQLLLENHGYTVFFDLDECNASSWEKRIKAGIEESKVFLFIMSQGALDRCRNEGDWVRKEVEYAYELKKNIVPINPDREFDVFPADCPELVRTALGQHSFFEIYTGQQLKTTVDALVKQRIMSIVKPHENVVTGGCLHLKSDMDCQVKWYDNPLCALEKGVFKDVYLEKGEHTLTFISVENPADRVVEEFTIESDRSHKRLEIELAPIRRERIAKEKAKLRWLGGEVPMRVSASKSKSTPRWPWMGLACIVLAVVSIWAGRESVYNPVEDGNIVAVVDTVMPDKNSDTPSKQASGAKPTTEKLIQDALEKQNEKSDEMAKLKAENERLREAHRQDSLAAVKKAEEERKAAERKAEAARKAEEAKKAQSTQVVATRPSNGYINGHEWVDLGLSVKWATCNVGASSASDWGNYYAWGETSTKTEYNYGECVTWQKNLGDISGDSRYDAARRNWGGSWRMPTKAECQELVNNCTWTWTTQGGHNGYKVTSKKNGNSIFLPAAGFRYGSSLIYQGEYGYYWSSTPYESDSEDAYYLFFYSSSHSVVWNYRYYGRTVRPVCD